MDEKFRRLMGDFGDLTVERRRLAWGGKKLKVGIVVWHAYIVLQLFSFSLKRGFDLCLMGEDEEDAWLHASWSFVLAAEYSCSSVIDLRW